MKVKLNTEVTITITMPYPQLKQIRDEHSDITHHNILVNYPATKELTQKIANIVDQLAHEQEIK